MKMVQLQIRSYISLWTTVSQPYHDEILNRYVKNMRETWSWFKYRDLKHTISMYCCRYTQNLLVFGSERDNNIVEHTGKYDNMWNKGEYIWLYK